MDPKWAAASAFDSCSVRGLMAGRPDDWREREEDSSRALGGAREKSRRGSLGYSSAARERQWAAMEAISEGEEASTRKACKGEHVPVDQRWRQL